MKKLYHLAPAELRGNFLYSLSELKTVYPDLYEKEVAKYKGREHVLEYFIKPLNCFWKDVVHLSPVHPAKIKKQLEKILDKLGQEYRNSKHKYIILKQKYYSINANRKCNLS